MSEQEKAKQLPTHRVSFARINGQDRQGNDILGASRQIGSIWARKDKEAEGILRFDHIPEEMRRDGGVVFVSKLDGKEGGGDGSAAQRQERPAKGRDDERDR